MRRCDPVTVVTFPGSLGKHLDLAPHQPIPVGGGHRGEDVGLSCFCIQEHGASRCHRGDHLILANQGRFGSLLLAPRQHDYRDNDSCPLQTKPSPVSLNPGLNRFTKRRANPSRWLPGPPMADWPYNTAAWQRLRRLKLSETPLCETCARRGRHVIAEHVDHVVSIAGGGHALDMTNVAVPLGDAAFRSS